MKTKAPKEDPSIKAARDREERRADAAFVEGAQGLLDEETRRRIRRFGKRNAASRAPGGAAGGGGGGSVGGGAGGALSGGGGGGFCPAPDTLVLMANAALDGPGGEIPAGEVQAGHDHVWTMHERTLQWGAYRVVSADRVEDQERVELVTDDGRRLTASTRHRLFTSDAGWADLVSLAPNAPLVGLVHGDLEIVKTAASGPVIKFIIEDAHTLITEGLLSHNAKMTGDGGGGLSDSNRFV